MVHLVRMKYLQRAALLSGMSLSLSLSAAVLLTACSDGSSTASEGGAAGASAGGGSPAGTGGSESHSGAGAGGSFTPSPQPAQATITVRIANLFAPSETPGPALDFVSNSLTDINKYEKIAEDVEYGALVGPLTLARVGGSAAIYVYPAGTDIGDGKKYPSGYTTGLLFTEDDVTDDQAVILADGHYTRAGAQHYTIPAGQAGILVLANTFTDNPAVGFVVDGACVSSTAGGDPMVAVAAGTHSLSLVDLGPGDCDPSTSPALREPIDLDLDAETITAIAATGTDASSPLLAIPDWRN